MKKVIILCLSLLFCMVSIPNIKAEEKEKLDITAEYAIAVDLQQDTVLYEKNADEKMYPASMTKIVTAIVALEMINNLEEEIEITKQDLETIFETNASAAYFNIGEKVTYKDLIYGAMLPSGADATRALAFNLCGDLETFVDKMNDLAKKLKLKNTKFTNTTGIHDDNHYTTANDLAIILRYALNSPVFLEAFSSYTYTSSNGIHNWVSTGMYYAKNYDVDISRIIGCKSGFTEESQRCLASLVSVDNREVIMIVGKSDREISASANLDTNRIAEYCENNYAEVKIHSTDDSIKELPIRFGVDDTYKVTYTNDVIVYLPTSYKEKDLKYTYTFDALTAPIKKDEKIGNIKIEYQGKAMYSQEVITNKELKRNTGEYILHLIISFIFPYGLSILFIIIYIMLYRYQPQKIK